MITLDDKIDQRIVKTHQILARSMIDQLERVPFGRIMVSGLCQAARVSRATFYAHFDDKYDLLRFTVGSLFPPLTEPERGGGAGVLSDYLVAHRAALRNLLLGADEETLGILSGLIPPLAGVKTEAARDSLRHAVFCQMLAGGTLRYLTWMAQGPASELERMNDTFFQLLRLFCDIYETSAAPRSGAEGRKEDTP